MKLPTKIDPFEIARLACLDWQKHGRSSACDLDYVLKVTSQLNAARRRVATRIQLQPCQEMRREEIPIKLLGADPTRGS
ncbi:MAG: hypothetical protein ABSH48_08705 [Verrucomicrobiota bacterium]